MRRRDMAQRLRILLVASEVAPFAKTGGLADVAGALPRALARPRPRRARPDAASTAASRPCAGPLRIVVPRLPGAARRPRRSRARSSRAGAPPACPSTSSQQDHYYDRDGALRHRRRRLLGQLRALRLLLPRRARGADRARRSGAGGLAPAGHPRQRLADRARPRLPRARSTATTRRCADVATVFTIHNLAYQGVFWHYDMPMTGLGWDLFTPAGHRVLRQAQLPEGRPGLLRPAHHGQPHLRARDPHARVRQRARGRARGAEPGPARRRQRHRLRARGTRRRTRPSPQPYSAGGPGGKAACREALRARARARRRGPGPLIGMVTRLAEQKGLDLVLEALPAHPGRGLPARACSGSGDARLEEAAPRLAAARIPGQVAVRIGYDDGPRPPDLRGRRLLPHALALRAVRARPAHRAPLRHRARRAAHRRARRHGRPSSTRPGARAPASSSTRSRRTRCSTPSRRAAAAYRQPDALAGARQERHGRGLLVGRLGPGIRHALPEGAQAAERPASHGGRA